MMQSPYWSWLAWYLIAGIAALVATTFILNRDAPENWKKFGDGKLIRNSPLMLVALLTWPLAVYMVLADKLHLPQPGNGYKPKNEFHCQRKHLTKRVTIAEAEAAGRVVDPLHRVSDLPFGHLHQAWEAFTAKLTWKDRLWAFTIPGELDVNTSGRHPKWATPRDAKRGYAVVRWRRVRAEFIFEWD